MSDTARILDTARLAISRDGSCLGMAEDLHRLGEASRDRLLPRVSVPSTGRALVQFLADLRSEPLSLFFPLRRRAAPLAKIALDVASEQALEAIVQRESTIAGDPLLPPKTLALRSAWDFAEFLPQLVGALAAGRGVVLEGTPGRRAVGDRLTALIRASGAGRACRHPALRWRDADDGASVGTVGPNPVVIDGLPAPNTNLDHVILGLTAAGGDLPNRPHNVFVSRDGLGTPGGDWSLRQLAATLEMAAGQLDERARSVAYHGPLKVHLVDGGAENRYTQLPAEPRQLNLIVCDDMGEALERASFIASSRPAVQATLFSRRDTVIEAGYDVLAQHARLTLVNPELANDCELDEAVGILLETVLRANRNWLAGDLATDAG